MDIARTLDLVLREHLNSHRQMALVSGPRQVGKTTACRGAGDHYLNWDDQDDRRVITRGPQSVMTALHAERLREERPVVVFDELHKYPRWRLFLKGLYDKHADDLRVIVTGSSRLDLYRRGGDSLMGRYFLYRMHPLSVGELLDPAAPDVELRPPAPLPKARLQQLLTHGGFPEPFTKNDPRFSRRWQRLRAQQLVRQDIRDLTPLQELGRIEILVAILNDASGAQLSYSSLARETHTSVDTARRWVALLCTLHHGFLVRPWFKNVAKSLRKEPKWYVRDWSVVRDPGPRVETFVACHLLKAVETWEDAGLGTFALHYLRDKNQREVDFVVTRDGQPWFLVEAKQSDTALSGSLAHFQRAIRAPHAFQAVMDLPFVRANPFDHAKPMVVPIATLLSQLP